KQRHQTQTHASVYSAHKRQSGADDPDTDSRMGISPTVLNVSGTHCRALAVPAPLQLPPTASWHQQTSADLAHRWEQPVENRHLVLGPWSLVLDDVRGRAALALRTKD